MHAGRYCIVPMVCLVVIAVAQTLLISLVAYPALLRKATKVNSMAMTGTLGEKYP